ncbi:hypothetical protein [Phenylobacterium sp.]|uniref:hypothetical protein n=1 Tax=Phenylobacterium sp. TaxID=1871053 RepID=UPI003982E691
MKTTVIAALAALVSLAAAPALAQTTAAATASASAALNVETTPIEVIAANEKAKAVIDKELPGLTAHEAYPQFKQMTLQQLMPMSQGVITDEKLKTVQAELDKVK